MQLFKSKDNKCEIFICIWEWCPTWCQSCNKTIQKTKEYKLEELKKQIDISHKISDENFSYFLYWTNNISNSYISEITNYLDSLNRNYRIQIPLSSNLEDLEKLTNKNIQEFVISKKIASSTDIKELIKSIQSFYNKKNIIVNYDLLIDEKLIPVLEKILKINFEKNSDSTLSKTIKNIDIHLRKLYFINYKEKKIDNLEISSCFIYDSFNIKNNFIEILDHYEIDKNLEITFHNPLCYIWQHKVTNLEQNNEKIIEDFKEYKNHYLEKLNNDFEKNCFKCITNWFRYNKI